MNKERREELLEVTQILEEAYDKLEEIRDDEQEAFDSLPEGLQYSSTGTAIQTAIDTMDDFSNSIVELSNKIAEFAKPPKKKKKT